VNISAWILFDAVANTGVIRFRTPSGIVQI
jgi:hypothetical protein